MNIEQYNLEMNTNYFRANTYHAVKNPQINSTSGNHHLMNAIHYCILKRENKLTDKDRNTASNFIHDCSERLGIYNRAPDKFDHQAHDDYLAISVTSKLLGLFHATIINNTPYYYFDNTEETSKFELKNWHGRFPWAIFTYKTCAGEIANLFYQLVFCGYLVSSMFNKDLTDTSGRILRWIQKEAVKGKYKLVDFFIDLWEKDIVKKYPEAMGTVMGIYYGDDHPFSQVLKGKV